MKGYLLEAEHEIKLTDITEVSVQRLHQAMNEFKYCQLILQATDISSTSLNGLMDSHFRISAETTDSDAHDTPSEELFSRTFLRKSH